MIKDYNCSIRFALIIAIFLILLTTQTSAQQWISFDDTTSNVAQPEFQVKESSVSGVSFEVTVPGMSVREIEHRGITYQRLTIPEYLWNDQVGAPEVPVIRALVAIPECEDIILEATATDSTFRENFKVYPLPGLIDDKSSDGFLKERFTLDTEVYSANAFFPGKTAEVLTTGYIRDQRIAQVAIYPVQFHPVDNRLKTFSRFEVHLSFVSASGALLKNVGPFDKMCRSNIINYE